MDFESRIKHTAECKECVDGGVKMFHSIVDAELLSQLAAVIAEGT